MLGLIITALIAYLIGSIPFGVLVTRVAGAADPRTIGSGNIGATNVLRTGRKDLAAVTLLADALKGTLAVVLAMHLGLADDPRTAGLVAAAGAFFGHLFPVFLGFRGGKGVATFLGCLTPLAWPAALAFAVVWGTSVLLTRYSSIGALSASAATPIVLLVLGQRPAAALFLALASVLWWKHRANIVRLAEGTESKVGRAT